MRYIIFIFAMILAVTTWGQTIERYGNYTDYAQALRSDDDKIYVVNYWATWCGPCVKEMPFFEELTATYNDIEVVLVSIDFADQYEKRLLPYLTKHQLKSRVIHMSDPKPNDWIDEIDPSWSGAIPATVFYQGDRKLFLEREFHDYKDLESALINFKNN